MKTVHIISHSHWDREWYLPYERHHMLLVELIDDVLELFETDPEFKSFYLDGQTIILDDYLEVRPEKEDLLRKYIENGQLKTGPFYILQDAFLTSSESNVRNMLVGHQENKKWGVKTAIGYYPDTFGNPGQTPQLMKQLGFDFAAYGRGVKPTGFANQSKEEDNFVSSYSEMKWQGVDGSEILGLLFANWYNNGNEIPSEREAAKRYWKQKLREAESFASTDHLLLMNGCDHQPVQKDLSKAIQLANELYPEVTFIHSDFPTYMEKLRETLPKDLDTVKGELTSQETEGWHTLTNTASSRVYLKQQNDKTGRLLEQIAEPLATFAYEVTGEYPHDVLDYAWKVFMKNHPHDSICGCSVDEVHAEMETRFQKAQNIAGYVIDEAANELVKAVDTESHAPENSVPFVVFNTAGSEKTATAKVIVELDVIPFSEQSPADSYDRLQKKKEASSYKVVNKNGEEIEAVIEEMKPRFGYDLPKDQFRQPYMARRLKVSTYLEQVPGLSWQTLYLVPSEPDEIKESPASKTQLENDWLTVSVENNGTLTLTDKKQGQRYTNFLIFEDCGDIGNEYVYKQPNNEKAILSKGKLTDVSVTKETSFVKEITLKHTLSIPLSADELLEEEQRKMVEFRYRRAQRVEKTKPLEIETILSLEKNSPQLTCRTKMTNEMKDHRLRVLFKTDIESDVHFSDTLFETVERQNEVSKVWTNPENPQRTHRFINVHEENRGLILALEGIKEYEVIKEDNKQLTAALTLFRATGELGDWGYFPTPEAQCLGRTFEFVYQISFHGKEDRESRIKEAIDSPIPFTVKQTSPSKGKLPVNGTFGKIKGEQVALTALKRKKESNEAIMRFYNFTPKVAKADTAFLEYSPVRTTILEEKEEVIKEYIDPFEVVTLKWK